MTGVLLQGAMKRSKNVQGFVKWSEHYIPILQSQDGQHVGCVTDRIGDGSYLTIPVYATMCSAMCYETNPKYLNRIVRCPHPGERVHTAALANIIR